VSGSGGRLNITSADLKQLREDLERRLEREQASSEVNAYLRDELLAANDRDVDAVNRHLDQIRDALGDRVEEFDRLLMGGSIAKHTYVEGFSDVDSIVVVGAEGEQRPPEEFREEFARILRGALSAGEVDDISVGRRAVTVKFRDGTEVQLLPAMQQGDAISISSAEGTQWQSGIRPQDFAIRLTDLNRAQAGMPVRTIKLAKEVLANSVPEDRRPSGYHVEALALDLLPAYEGPRTPKEMLTYLFRASSDRVLAPLPDVTGQSRNVDDGLGGAGSPERRSLSQRLGAIADTMEGARTLAAWKGLFGE